METLDKILNNADFGDEFADLLGDIWVLKDRSFCGLVLEKKSDPNVWIPNKIWQYVSKPLKRHYTHEFKWKIEEPRNEDLIKESIKKLAEQFGLQVIDPSEPQAEGPADKPYKNVWEGYLAYEENEQASEDDDLDIVTNLYITDICDTEEETERLFTGNKFRKFRITTESID